VNIGTHFQRLFVQALSDVFDGARRLWVKSFVSDMIDSARSPRPPFVVACLLFASGANSHQRPKGCEMRSQGNGGTISFDLFMSVTALTGRSVTMARTTRPRLRPDAKLRSLSAAITSLITTSAFWFETPPY
jgi:hypothetical protein